MDMTYMYIPALIPVIFILYGPIWRNSCWAHSETVHFYYTTAWPVLERSYLFSHFDFIFMFFFLKEFGIDLALPHCISEMAYWIHLYFTVWRYISCSFFRFLKIKSRSHFISIPMKTFLQELNLDVYIPCLKSVKFEIWWPFY